MQRQQLLTGCDDLCVVSVRIIQDAPRSVLLVVVLLEMWLSDNSLGKKVDFSSKAVLDKSLSMFWVKGAAQSLRQHVHDVSSGGVWPCGLRP